MPSMVPGVNSQVWPELEAHTPVMELFHRPSPNARPHTFSADHVSDSSVFVLRSNSDGYFSNRCGISACHVVFSCCRKSSISTSIARDWNAAIFSADHRTGDVGVGSEAMYGSHGELILWRSYLRMHSAVQATQLAASTAATPANPQTQATRLAAATAATPTNSR